MEISSQNSKTYKKINEKKWDLYVKYKDKRE